MNDDRCLDPQTLAGRGAWPEGDPRLAHLRECPRCRALLASLHLFEAGGASDLPAERLADARARLASARQDWPGLAAAGAAPRRTARRPARAWAWPAWGRGPRLAMAALALAAVAFAALWMGRSAPGPRPGMVLRSGEDRASAPGPATVRTLPQRLEGGRPVLHWGAVRGADAYEVVLLDAGLEVLASRSAGSDTVIALDAFPAGAAPPGKAAYWQVTARRGGDPLAESAPIPLETLPVK